MAITGHKTVAMAEHYARRANTRKRAAAAVGRLEDSVEILSVAQVAGIRADATPKLQVVREKAQPMPPSAKAGTASPNAVLTDADVLAIYRSTESHRKLASLYNVSRSLVSQIKAAQVWKHILPPRDKVPSERTPNT